MSYNKDFLISKMYDYDPEPGNDFTYDEHGNVIYGCGFCGAPRLPFRDYGMNVRDFIKTYLTIDEKDRLNFLDNPLSNNISERLDTIISYLRTYENNKDKVELTSKLDEFVLDCLPKGHYYSPQIKYFIELLNLIKMS